MTTHIHFLLIREKKNPSESHERNNTKEVVVVLTDTGDVGRSGTLSKSPRLAHLRTDSEPKKKIIIITSNYHKIIWWSAKEYEGQCSVLCFHFHQKSLNVPCGSIH